MEAELRALGIAQDRFFEEIELLLQLAGRLRTIHEVGTDDRERPLDRGHGCIREWGRAAERGSFSRRRFDPPNRAPAARQVSAGQKEERRWREANASSCGLPGFRPSI